jgi:hypothetical protein
MRGDSMLPEDKFFQTNDEKKIWQRYCGFFDLSLDEFMEIQSRLLTEQIELVSNSILGKKILRGHKPQNVDEFRRLVPLTAYEDYEPYLSQQREDVLAEKPAFWCHSSGRSGDFKWIPYTSQATEVATKRSLALFIAAATTSKGNVNIRPGCRTLLILPPKPYMTGSVLEQVSKRFSLHVIPPQEEAEGLDFQKRIAESFRMSLSTGVDAIGSIASVMVKVGENMTEQAKVIKFSKEMLRPSILIRLASALIHSKIARRPMLPKDLWKASALVVGGVDLSIYKEQIQYYWGQAPLEIYASAEMYPMAMQAWNKKWMTPIVDCAFFEFIPEDELKKNNDNPEYTPKTVLLNKFEVGNTYEIVITHFHGMPLLRYRMRDLVTFMALQDKDALINIPQLMFKSRREDIITLASLAQLDERTIWQAIESAGLKNDGWSAVKEYDNNQAYLRLYLELKEPLEVNELEKRIDQRLKDIDIDYRDLDKMLGLNPVRVTLLPSGTFQRYYDEEQKRGADLAHLKPPHMNPSSETVQKLLQLSQYK